MLYSLYRRLSDPVTKWSWKQLTVGSHAGIIFVDITRAKAAREAFVKRTTEALELVQRADRRRFARVRSHFRYIVHSEMAFAIGQYDWRLHACRLDFTRLRFQDDPNRTLWKYAAILVHEATHGLLDARGIRLSQSNRQRVECICDKEAARFLRRYTRGAGDIWERASNVVNARPQTRTRWQRLCALLKRRTETARMTNRQGGTDGRQPFSSEANRTSAVAASRRSP
jgi:hypothetical protein